MKTVSKSVRQLTLEIRNLAHRAWLDRTNIEFVFREIGKRAQQISDLEASKASDHSCYHCDKPAEWIWNSEDGKEVRNICMRCSETIGPYMASSGRQFTIISEHTDDRCINPELTRNISRRVARECAVIAADADTNHDAEREILIRFDCE